MKAILALFLAVGASARAAAPGRPAAGGSVAGGAAFAGPAGARPAPGKGRDDVGGGGWGNRELEFYCAPGAPAPCDPDRPNAAQDGRGRLVISARKNASGKWTSARLTTRGLAEFTHGRIEARIRLPAAAGLWPAFWLLGVSTEGWPSCGEIDVMENVPGNVPGGLGPNAVKSTIHGPGYSGVDGLGKTREFPGGGRVDDEFHVYGTIWSPGKVQFYVDDWTKPFLTLTPRDVPKGRLWVYEHPFFVILNLAVGGSWPRDPDATTPNPAKMYVDYVRAYRPAP